MDAATYRRFTEHVQAWAEAHPDVIGLVAVGSTAERWRMPDEWSDHDFWVVADDAAAVAIRDDPSWLPDPHRIVLFFRETEHGRNAVYDVGHLIEHAVFGESELEVAVANHYRVLVDKGGIEGRMASIASATEARQVGPDVGATFGRFVGELVIGLSRFGRGELLSADSMVKQRALENLLILLGRSVIADNDAQLDNLDPRRRFEIVFPDLGARLGELVLATVPDAASMMLDVAEEHLAAVPGNTPDVRAALRHLIERVNK